MMFPTVFPFLALLLSGMLPSADAQCANNVAIYHPSLRTLTSNR